MVYNFKQGDQCLIEKVTFKQRLEGGEGGVSHVEIRRESIHSTENSHYKGPKGGMCLIRLRNSISGQNVAKRK